MQVFISFSGHRSRLVAEGLKTFIEDVLQAVKPFMSSDIPKGTAWPGKLAGALETCRYGIICLTPENLAEGWVLFEAGALSKALQGVAVPYLLDLDPSAVPHPIGLLQAARADREDTLQIVKGLNASLPEASRLSEERLGRGFETFWPSLHGKLEHALELQRSTTQTRGLEEMVKEILDLVRLQAQAPRRNERERFHETLVTDLTSDLSWAKKLGILRDDMSAKQVADTSRALRAILEETVDGEKRFWSPPDEN